MTLLFLFLFMGSTVAAGGAQQKKAVPIDSAKTVKPVKDTVAKKDSVAAVRFGRIKVTSVPESAEVSIDSIPKGNSPCTLDSLKPGSHVLIIKQKGYFGKKVSIDVGQDSTVVVEVALVKPAGLVIASAPAGAAVIIDGKDAGVTPYENTKVKPGDHVVRLEKQQYIPLEKTITSTEGKTDSLSLTLSAVKVQQSSAAAPAQPAPKRGLDTTILIILTGVFVLFGIGIFAVESGSK